MFGGTAEYVALSLKAAGYESVFFWYVAAMAALVLAASIWMPDTRIRGYLDGTAEPGSWILVAADGSRGRVRTDPAAHGLIVLYAVEPIAGAPDLPVGPPPERAGR